MSEEGQGQGRAGQGEVVGSLRRKPSDGGAHISRPAACAPKPSAGFRSSLPGLPAQVSGYALGVTPGRIGPGSGQARRPRKGSSL